MFYRVARVSQVVVGHVRPLLSPPPPRFHEKNCVHARTDISGNGSQSFSGRRQSRSLLYLPTSISREKTALHSLAETEVNYVNST